MSKQDSAKVTKRWVTVEELSAAGVIEEHSYRGRFYSVCCPERLNEYWRQRRFD